ncbi:uncharacterized protein [Ptychodera flava]|uniref:uncharacterized protein n=1 Tax=Ptychodera flava TaxID=63121 RepID=UPI00396A881F
MADQRDLSDSIVNWQFPNINSIQIRYPEDTTMAVQTDAGRISVFSSFQSLSEVRVRLATTDIPLLQFPENADDGFADEAAVPPPPSWFDDDLSQPDPSEQAEEDGEERPLIDFFDMSASGNNLFNYHGQGYESLEEDVPESDNNSIFDFETISEDDSWAENSDFDDEVVSDDDEVVRGHFNISSLHRIRVPVLAVLAPKQRPRSPTTANQKRLLELAFNNMTSPYPSMDEKKELSTLTGLSYEHIDNWFAKRRVTERRLRRGIGCTTSALVARSAIFGHQRSN